MHGLFIECVLGVLIWSYKIPASEYKSNAPYKPATNQPNETLGAPETRLPAGLPTFTFQSFLLFLTPTGQTSFQLRRSYNRTGS